MDARLQVPAGQKRQRISDVDGDAASQRLDPLPLLPVARAHLQAGDGLAQQQREGAEVRVAVDVALDVVLPHDGQFGGGARVVE